MRKALLATILLGLAGATVVAACGDDNNDKGNAGDGDQPGDGDGDGDQPGDGDGDKPGDGDGDGDKPGDGDGDGDNNPDGGPGDGDGDGDTSTELDACPTSPNITDGGQVCVITAPQGNEIAADLTLAPVKNKMGYVIQDGVFVGQDVGPAEAPAAGKKQVTLTVKPGTTFFGATALSFLAVNRGSKIVAEGTAEKPIVFTSGSENAPAPGDWGGVLLLGRADTNIGKDNTGEVGNVKYGGPLNDDDSGSLKYVRIEFAGGRIDPTHEFNGLTLYGVGSKTKLDYIHVHAGGDDAVEFFGGAANLKHFVATASGDDNIDWTDGWSGKVQFAVAQQYPNFGDNGFEADNRDMNNTAEPYSNPTISNVTLIGAGVSGNYGMLLRRGTKGNIFSSLVLNWKTACLKVNDQTTVDFVNKSLKLSDSRINCTKEYEEDAMVMNSTASQDLVEKGTGNMVLASADVLTKPLDYTAAFDPKPKADSGLLTGGAVPDDAFFEKVTFIGAFGAEDWTAGNWVKITEFVTPAM